MLVLSRKLQERIVINGNITVSIERINGNRVTLGIEAPSEIHIWRGELPQTHTKLEEKKPKELIFSD